MSAEARTFRGGARLVGALSVGLAGLALVGLGLAIEPARAWFAYLTAFAFGVSLALAALVFVMVSHVTGATWFVVLRRHVEGIAATLPLFAVLFVPVAIGLDSLYPWVPPIDDLEPHVARLVEHKRPYLNVPFFLVRAALFFALWIGLAHFLRRWSLEQDAGGDPIRLAARQRRLSAAGFPPLAVALTFAAIDWLMSLEPAWYSTIFGVYYFAGAFVAAIALAAVVTRLSERAGPLADLVAPSHYLTLGKLLLAFTVFWAYIAFAQFFITWIADVPEEIQWYRHRTEGRWAIVGGILAAGHFVIPFVLLLSRGLKARPAVLTAVAVWLLIMHYVDVYWLVLPASRGTGPVPHWLDLAALAGVVGLAVAFGIWRARGVAVVPRRDPALAASLEYQAS